VEVHQIPLFEVYKNALWLDKRWIRPTATKLSNILFTVFCFFTSIGKFSAVKTYPSKESSVV
jgi:hypothetical protein